MVSGAEIRIVGIGASAGGLEALEDFFRTIPFQCGMAFVIVQPALGESYHPLDGLLARYTRMGIQHVDKKTAVQTNQIYLSQPKSSLALEKGHLVPTASASTNFRVESPIDDFLASLAEKLQHRAIGVILSGSGSDGTTGCTLIKRAGGLVIAQDPANCRFASMPGNVIREGIADHVLPAVEIPPKLLEHFQSGTEKSTEKDGQASEYLSTTKLLYKVDGIDFSGYRVSTIMRCIERRYRRCGFRSLGAYFQELQRSPRELRELHKELLIGVTFFFRDSEAFHFVRETMGPNLLESFQGAPALRVWAAGCSSGEEVYSLCICLLEAMQDSGIHLPLKVFATDLDREALAFAAVGRYPSSIASRIEPEYLEKYFNKLGEQYEVVSFLRRSIIFSPHNTVSDPPFTSMHLIVCRNLLIYFQPDLQKRALSLFHFGLHKGGYLFLGKSESLGELDGAFETISSRAKVFRKRDSVKLASLMDLGVRFPEKKQLPCPPLRSSKG